MILEDLLKRYKYLAYANGIIYLEGQSSCSKINGKSELYLHPGTRFIDLKNQKEGHYFSLETFINQVTIPFLKRGTAKRSNVDKEQFSFLPIDYGFLLTRNQGAIIRKKDTPKPKAILSGTKYELVKLSSPEEIILLHNNSSSMSTKGTKGYTAKTNKRSIDIYCPLQTFIMSNTNGEQFKFSNINIRVKIRNEAGKYVIDDPYDVNMNHHPFIYSCGRVCLGKAEFKDNLGIQDRHTHLSFDLAEDITSTFVHTQRILTNGYSQGVNPVKTLSKHNFSKEYRGKQYAA